MTRIAGAAFRAHRLRLAVSVSLVSKLVAAASALLVLPVVVLALGEARYAAFLGVTALVAWIGPLGFGLLPALTRALSEAAARHDPIAERRLVSFGLLLTLAMAAILLACTLWAAGHLDIARLVGTGAGVLPSEVTAGFVAAVGTVSIHFFAATSGAIRAGYQEIHWTSSWTTLANLMVVVAVFAADHFAPDMAAFALALYLPITLCYLADYLLIFRSRPYLWPPLITFKADGHQLPHASIKGLLRTSAVTWGVQLHNCVVLFASVLLVAHLSSDAETAAFGTVMRVLLLGSGLITVVIFPLVPALSDAYVRGEGAWIRLNYLRLMRLTLLFSGAVAVALVVAGPLAFRLWLHGEVDISWPLCAGFGAFFIVWMANTAAFNVLLAVGHSRGCGLSFIAEAVLAVALAAPLASSFGATGAIAGLTLAGVATNGWLLQLRLARLWREMAAAPTPR